MLSRTTSLKLVKCTHNSCFRPEIRKIRYTLVDPIFLGIQWVFPGCFLHGLVAQITKSCFINIFLGGLQLSPSSVIGNIEFQDISFTYPSREHAQIFSGLSLKVPAGSVTALVGSSGSGKSTLGGLLLRFYDPEKGNFGL